MDGKRERERERIKEKSCAKNPSFNKSVFSEQSIRALRKIQTIFHINIINSSELQNCTHSSKIQYAFQSIQTVTKIFVERYFYMHFYIFFFRDTFILLYSRIHVTY